MRKTIFSAVLAMGVLACAPQTQDKQTQNKVLESPKISLEATSKMSAVQHPDWARDAVIYQINTRQYSEAGNFAAVKADLPRIKSLGVDILWFMPIHPIGEEKRKGYMGSPYAVKDFRAVNPELGTLEDFKALVEDAQAMGMKVIIDWVANHTAWDNHLIYDHPDWYSRNEAGDMIHPAETDWVDVADLDYSQQGLREYMTDALVYWVKEVGIDGYRCDVAGMVPTDFWNNARQALDAVKPVFMLAEWQEPELHDRAFSASYAWRWKEIMQDIVKGEANVSDMIGYYKDYQENWPRDAMRMTYTSNHDQNTWDGTPMEIYGDALEVAMALAFVGEGIPLIYNGQESGNQNRLAFFEKDLIEWNEEHPYQDVFRALVDLKTMNPALHNGPWGARLEVLPNDRAEEVFSFVRQSESNKVIGVFNLSERSQTVTLETKGVQGAFKAFGNAFGREDRIEFSETAEMTLEPWGFEIFTQ